MNSISAEDYYVDFTEQQTAISFQSLLRVCKLLGFARKKHEHAVKKGWTARVVLGNDNIINSSKGLRHEQDRTRRSHRQGKWSIG